MDALEAILNRRSIRSYQPRPVEREKLVLLLRAATEGSAAPTAANSQPWEFVVVTEPERLARLREKLLFGRYNAPAAIVVCANQRVANNSAAQHYWVQDCSAATENVLLGPVALGLGAVWIGVHPIPGVARAVSVVLGIPDEVAPLGVVYVGYPAEEKPPSERYDERRVYWEEYEPRKRRAKTKNAKYN